MTGTIEEISCEFCSGSRQATYSWRGYQLHRCSKCGLESVDPQPSVSELSQFYQAISAKKFVRWERRLRLIESAFDGHCQRYLATLGHAPRSFLDLGGGAGYYSRIAQDRGIDTCLMEWAGDALDFAREILKVENIVEGDISRCADFIKRQDFDFVLARHTIEHMKDPAQFLRHISRVIQPGGILQVETPNASSMEQLAHLAVVAENFKILRQSNPTMGVWVALRHAFCKSPSGVNPPKHLWGFTRSSLSQLARQAGFEVLHCELPTAGHHLYDPLYFDLHRLGKRRGLGIPYYFWQRLALPFFRGRGSNLVLILQKRNTVPGSISPSIEPGSNVPT